MKRLIVCVAVAVLAGNASAFYMGFEEALGNDHGNIVGVPGVTFTTTAGQTWQYSDTTTGGYNDYSIDLGVGHGTQNYWHYGIGVAWLGVYGNSGRIDFDDKDGTWFQTGYCSASTFIVDAYNKSGVLIDSATGGANLKSFGYLRVDAPVGDSIAYLVMHDTGNYWIVDNMTGDMAGGVPGVPDGGASALLLGLGLAAVAEIKRRVAC